MYMSISCDPYSHWRAGGSRLSGSSSNFQGAPVLGCRGRAQIALPLKKNRLYEAKKAFYSSIYTY